MFKIIFRLLLKKTFNTLLHFGIKEGQQAHDKRRIKTVNLLNALVIFFLLVGFFNYFVLGTEMKLAASFIFLFLACFSVVLSKFFQTNLAFFFFTFNVNLSNFFINETYPQAVGSYLFYFPIIVSIVLLNRPSIRDKHALLHAAVCLAFLMTNLLIDIPQWQIQNLDESQIKLMFYVNLVMSATLTGLLSGLLSRLISNQNLEIVLRNEFLLKAKEDLDFSLKEKEVLLAELHHRVKNNLAIITGLLNLQEEATHSDEAKQVIGDSKARIMSMALVHKMLYEQSDLKSIDIGRYASQLVKGLFDTYNLSKNVEVVEEYEVISLPISKLIPLGLILNEVVTNSIKYVYRQKPANNGRFHIKIEQINGLVYIKLRDNGSGFPQDYNQHTEGVSLGIYLIKTLAEQIDGRVHFSSENGAKIELVFSLN